MEPKGFAPNQHLEQVLIAKLFNFARICSGQWKTSFHRFCLRIGLPENRFALFDPML
jgi:hypothetical protein